MNGNEGGEMHQLESFVLSRHCIFFSGDSGKSQLEIRYTLSHHVQGDSPENQGGCCPPQLQPPRGRLFTCKYFAQGRCTKGAACSFSHETPPPEAADGVGVAPGAAVIPSPVEGTVTAAVGDSDTRKLIPCKYFARRLCRNGEQCVWSHAQDSQEGGSAAAARDGVGNNEHDDHLSESRFKEPRASKNDWSRLLGGAAVRFEDGLRVDKVSLPSDYSAVRLSRLPPGSTQASVASLLEELGFGGLLPKADIRMQEQHQQQEQRPDAGGAAGHCSADVKVEDPTFAKAVCAKVFASRRDLDSVAVAAPVTAAPNSSSMARRIDCRKIHCSWHRPVRLVWMNFGGRDVAEKVQQRFASGTSRILDQPVDARDPPRGASDWRNPLSWTVTLKAVPGQATEADVLRSIPMGIRPRRVTLGQPTYRARLDLVSAGVKSLLAAIGPLDWWECAPDSGAKRAKAQARFLYEEDARKAAQSLHDAPLPCSGAGTKVKLTVQLVTSAKFRVSESVYRASQARIEEVGEVWDKQLHVRLSAYPPDKGFRALRLEGEQTHAVAQAANALETILNGALIVAPSSPATAGGDNDRRLVPLWSPSFVYNGAAFSRVKGLEKDLGVYIERDRRACRLKVFGPEAVRETVYGRVAAIVEEEAQSVGTYTIPLSQSQMRWAGRGGFGLRTLIRTMGKRAAVAFDNPLHPKNIVITGGEDEYREAVMYVQSHQPVTENGHSLQDTPEANDCAVCWSPAEEPVLTSCGHMYCGDCFLGLCQSSFSVDTIAKGGEEAMVRCRGDSDRCHTVLGLTELEENLATEKLEGLLAASFAAHVAKRPLEYRYCPTPDCGNIYRVAAVVSSSDAPSTTAKVVAKPFTCSGCLQMTCTRCHEDHDGAAVSCAAYAAQSAAEKTREVDAATGELMHQLGIKACPKCRTHIEKTFGCDHMLCKACGTHICWACLAMFAKSGECYAHMQKTHSDRRPM
ncbi:hypothetical protein PG996_007451 [Apiospora saccharicola]|uniref:RBR-type E3 ubiquitin transferase n=1 Tax=Apiospora saccharicola TaxID=335842 RepID=A0ABR1VAW0_9PEZI